MKKIHIELTDKQHCLLTRIAKADKRKLGDFVYLIIAEGLTYFFCETSTCIEKTPDEYTQEERKQQAKNEKLEKTKGWDDLDWEEKQAKGFESVSSYMHNSYGNGDDFLDALTKSLERNAFEGINEQEGETA